ncbi:hypothetical protein [Rhodococcus qingshengii]|uniref:hypothetical protein n=1 Tax=Rhodococcus qingshengii TaxID=334542 RepID=UPI002943D2A9|nr:hypothetical protein [Rhodococcus qingshengii]WOI85951.1 hypothetical protein R0122_22490 [Rhodococcus qingshengii]
MSETDKRLIGGLPYDVEPLVTYMHDEDDDQIPLHTEREWVAEQEPHVIRALGTYCIQRASEFAAIAQHCQDELVELGEIKKPRTRALDFSKRAMVFVEGGDA